MLAVGCACGMVFTRSRVLGGIILFVAILLGILGTIFLYVTSGTWGEANLGVLPVVLTAGAVGVAGASEGFLWRAISRYTVK